MNKFARIVRLISLSMLFGGGTAIVFAAITLVHAAKAHGVPANEAAAVNAPIFIEFAKVAAAFAIALVAAEAVEIKGDLHNLEKRSRWPMARYFSSILAAVATFIFAFAIVPPMSDLQPKLRSDAAAQTEFRRLHEISRAVFSVMIVFSLVSLVVPVLSSSRNLE